MSERFLLQLAQRGVIVIPKSLRETYHLQPGDQLTLLDLEGVFVLSPRQSEIDALADRIARALLEKDETLETMLLAIREEREKYAG